VTTFDGGRAKSTFRVTTIPLPKITSFSPSPIYSDTTVAFSLRGSYFEPAGRTTVSLTNATGYTIVAIPDAVYQNAVIGTVTIPSGIVPGSWSVRVDTLDGGTTVKANAVKIL
jgi:hypothetical protein